LGNKKRQKRKNVTR